MLLRHGGGHEINGDGLNEGWQGYRHHGDRPEMSGGVRATGEGDGNDGGVKRSSFFFLQSFYWTLKRKSSHSRISLRDVHIFFPFNT